MNLHSLLGLCIDSLCMTFHCFNFNRFLFQALQNGECVLNRKQCGLRMLDC